jgi:hypothetical protein
MPREIARILVLAQFDLPIPGFESEVSPSQMNARSTALYPAGKHAAELRAAVLAKDTKAVIKESGNQLRVTALPIAQRVATDVWLRTPSKSVPKVVDVDAVRFTLRLQNAVAEQVLQQLASTSGRTLTIDPTVAEACKLPISLAVQEETLRELTQRIADEVQVLVSWTNTELKVTAIR